MGEVYDDTILLKIKRDFTENEAVQQLLKMVSELEIEIGMLKSERDEWKDKADKIRSERTQTRKQWLQDEIFISVQAEITHLKIKQREYKKKMEEWRNKYFSLLASTNHD